MTSAFEDKPRPRQLDDVKGWFPPLDQLLFQKLLTRQESLGERGDLMEIGVFMGKSAIVVGSHLQDGEKFTVCDLFESEAPDGANIAEMAKSYSSLTRDSFEANYLSFHDELPRVLQGPSSIVPGEVQPKSCRFVHVDASHLYEHVHGDIGAAQEALLPGGIVVLDDFRSEHTPGVSIAAWDAVLNRGLNLICLSTQKLYATWDDPKPIQDELIAMGEKFDTLDLTTEEAAGHRVVRFRARGLKAPEFPHSKHYTKTPKTVAAPAGTSAPKPKPAPVTPKPARSVAARVAIDVLPPVITRAVRRSRAAKRARG